ncbi:MAG: adenylate/guanylate cyclase domain-containing protein [Thermodesulfobacteriota bacterium]|nr:adenylate/guanylate cyclase domain-containing protein [Thermodesulfobacteriota bacterium]
MEKNRNRLESAESDNIEEILREIKRLEKIIQEKFKKQVTVLFTDICGYTKYMDTRGDVNGRAMLQKHNDIAMPLIEKHDGMVIKTIGDAIMATFSNPLVAVKSSMAIQNSLYDIICKSQALPGQSGPLRN